MVIGKYESEKCTLTLVILRGITALDLFATLDRDVT